MTVTKMMSLGWLLLFTAAGVCLSADRPGQGDSAGPTSVQLRVAARPEDGERILMLDQGAQSLPTRWLIETDSRLSLGPEDVLRLRFHEVFSGKDTERIARMDKTIPAGGRLTLVRQFPAGDLAPGYYLVTADIERGGLTLLGGRVGSDDLYVRKPGERMTYSVLSIRTGMILWIRDLLNGGIMGWCRAAPPHVYDPRNRTTYADFIKLHAIATWKHTEGNEAGNTGLAIAAEAFRKMGDPLRCRYSETLLEESIDYMIRKMQAPTGGVRAVVNELAEAGIGKDWASLPFGAYDSNQIGEWIRALTYAIIYYSRLPEKRATAMRLSAACRKSADYLVAHALQTSDGIPDVLRHLSLEETPDGRVRQVTYHQESRQCDVYLGRALAGLSYYAYAMQLLGERVPEKWWTVMENTARWCERKMKPNGWFDWQCEDIVEGGCHTFLGNIYLGEGIFGVYLANRQAGKTSAAERAAGLARKAYTYVIRDCAVKGVPFAEGPAAAELWVGPYVYWLFTEYLDAVGPEKSFSDWIDMLDRIWRVDHGWKDLLDRPATEGTYVLDRRRTKDEYVQRASQNGMLAVAVLGSLGIRLMSEIGAPFHWDFPDSRHSPERAAAR